MHNCESSKNKTIEQELAEAKKKIRQLESDLLISEEWRARWRAEATQNARLAEYHKMKNT